LFVNLYIYLDRICHNVEGMANDMLAENRVAVGIIATVIIVAVSFKFIEFL